LTNFQIFYPFGKSPSKPTTYTKHPLAYSIASNNFPIGRSDFPELRLARIVNVKSEEKFGVYVS